jgi:hypothetical protein
MNELALNLTQAVAEAAPRLRGIDETEAGRGRGDGKWVAKEILGHLIDSAANNHQRFVRARTADPFVWPGYEQEFWVSVHAYRSRGWSELVDLWAALNQHVAYAIDSVPADRLATRCVIGNEPPQPLEWWMRDYVRHLKHHLSQIFGA